MPDEPRKSRGRPRADVDRLSPVSLKMRVSDHDRLIALADQQRTSVSALARGILVQSLRVSASQ